MSLEAIKAINAAEEKAKHAKSDAVVAGKKMIAEAEAKGVNKVEAAKNKARAEVAKKRKLVADEAKEQALDLIRNTENRKATMLVKAESKTHGAVDLVIERIVNS